MWVESILFVGFRYALPNLLIFAWYKYFLIPTVLRGSSYLYSSKLGMQRLNGKSLNNELFVIASHAEGIAGTDTTKAIP